jgi:Na+-transporting NADH:ubiquinone oxidoreductase subunit C
VKKRLFSVLYMFLLTLFFTSLVSAVRLLSEERIETNQRIKLERIILQVLGVSLAPGASNEAVSTIFQERITPIQVQDKTLYVHCAPEDETILGYAFPVGGPGFWGPIDGMVAVDPRASQIIGIAFFRHAETPGLGARINEDWFTEQFSGLPLFPVSGEEKLFYLKTGGTAQESNRLDAITGATGTSRAIEAFLNKELNVFLKKLWNLVEEKTNNGAKTSIQS